VSEHVAAAADWLAAPLRRLGLLSDAGAKAARGALLRATNWCSTPLLDHTSWWAAAAAAAAAAGGRRGSAATHAAR
jgi:hypothetical protein